MPLGLVSGRRFFANNKIKPLVSSTESDIYKNYPTSVDYKLD